VEDERYNENDSLQQEELIQRNLKLFEHMHIYMMMMMTMTMMMKMMTMTKITTTVIIWRRWWIMINEDNSKRYCNDRKK